MGPPVFAHESDVQKKSVLCTFTDNSMHESIKRNLKDEEKRRPKKVQAFPQAALEPSFLPAPACPAVLARPALAPLGPSSGSRKVRLAPYIPDTISQLPSAFEGQLE